MTRSKTFLGVSFLDVFYFKAYGVPHTHGYPYENMSLAIDACNDIGAHLASHTMLTEAYNQGLKCCACGHVSSKFGAQTSKYIV